MAERSPPGCVLLETCHRVELYGAPLGMDIAEAAPSGTNELHGAAVARHLVRLAVGRDSVVVAEDQVLHQLRSALARARSRGPLPTELNRLFDNALRTGRRARSWLPGRRGSLADVALHRVAGGRPARGQRVLIVGAGEMARQAAHTAHAGGAALLVASRTQERAQKLAAEVAAAHVPFDPGPVAVRGLDGVVVALSGAWPVGPSTEEALVDSGAWVVDLSAPSAVARSAVARLGDRFVAIDDLADDAATGPSTRMTARLDELVEEAVGEYVAWLSGRGKRATAHQLADKAEAARTAELDALWERLPALEPSHRREVERMAVELTERLLRDPLEQLHTDVDGRRARAARELFRL